MISITHENIPADPNAMKEYFMGVIENMVSEFTAEKEAHERQLKYYREQLNIMTARLYGRTSEKIPESSYGQGTLFDELELYATKEEMEKQKSNVIVIGEHRRTRNTVGRHPLPDTLPHVEKIIDLSPEEKVHSCGQNMVCIGEERSKKLTYIPAQFGVDVTVRKKYACPCEGINDAGESAIRIAPKPEELMPKSIASASLLAYIVVSKFCDALPLYRLEKIFKRIGVIIKRQMMSFWLMTLYDKLKILGELIEKDIRGGPLIGMDETPVQVLNEKDRANTTKSYMWVARGTFEKKPVLLYTYSPTRSAQTPKNLLAGYDGVVQCDGFSAYNVLTKELNITRAGCWAHARRYFVEAQKAGDEKSLANEMIDLIGQLYGVEEEALIKNMTPDERKNIRMEKSYPIIMRIKEWLDTHVSKVPPSLLLGKAIAYARNEWDTLIVYIKNPHVRIDNNFVENAIRPFVLGRKNWQFCGSPQGARTSALFYSLIETAKANGHEPLAYITHLFDKLPHVVREDDFRALLPYRIDSALK
jgi:transposase